MWSRCNERSEGIMGGKCRDPGPGTQSDYIGGNESRYNVVIIWRSHEKSTYMCYLGQCKLVEVNKKCQKRRETFTLIRSEIREIVVFCQSLAIKQKYSQLVKHLYNLFQSFLISTLPKLSKSDKKRRRRRKQSRPTRKHIPII